MQFASHRVLLTALLRAGIDPRDRLSPFGEETTTVRDDNIGWYARAIEGSDVAIPKDLAPELPRLLWLYHMGLIYYWIRWDHRRSSVAGGIRQRMTSTVSSATSRETYRTRRTASGRSN